MGGMMNKKETIDWKNMERLDRLNTQAKLFEWYISDEFLKLEKEYKKEINES